MALSVPDIKISVTANSTCDGLNFEDTTGNYNAVTNPDGWGLPSGPATTSVTSFKITLVNESDDTSLLYSFTVSAGTITAATLSVDGGTANNILSSLPSTTFPFTSANTFELLGDYGVDVPALEDAVYRVYYEVKGTANDGSGTPTAFDYTIQDAETVNCDVCCCVSKMFLDLDPDCGCDDKSYYKATRGWAYMMAAVYTTEANGDVDKAVANLKMAQDICSGNCNCGC